MNIKNTPLSVQYNAARNYSTLYSIVQKQPVICIINIKENTDEKMGDEHCQRKEILVTAHVENERIKVGTIGIEYFSAKNFEDFERLCQKYELSYIRPIDCYVIETFTNYTTSFDTLEEALKYKADDNTVIVYEARIVNI